MSYSFTHALVRAIPDSYQHWSTPARPMSLELARRQHRRYVQALEQAGLHVDWVEADERHFDCVFIEDTAILWHGVALITRMDDHREGEQAAVSEKLRSTHTLIACPPGATIEGGDVLHIEETTYVGLSTRTNQAGVETLAKLMSRFGRRVVSLPVADFLHLKTGVTYLGNGALLAAPGALDFARFDVEQIIFTHADEPGAANCLRIGNHLLIPAGYPATERRLRPFADAHKIDCIALEISELEKGEGSLTCLSLLW